MNKTNRTSAYAVWLGSNVCGTIGPRNFLIAKKGSANNFSIDLLISNSHGPSMYTLSQVATNSDVSPNRKKSYILLNTAGEYELVMLAKNR